MITNLKIGAVNYAVSVVDDLHFHDNKRRKRSLNGHILHSEAQIKLDADMSEDMKLITLWHEALHGILAVAGHDDEPESFIVPLGYGLVALLRDNPELVKLTIGA